MSDVDDLRLQIVRQRGKLAVDGRVAVTVARPRHVEDVKAGPGGQGPYRRLVCPGIGVSVRHCIVDNGDSGALLRAEKTGNVGRQAARVSATRPSNLFFRTLLVLSMFGVVSQKTLTVVYTKSYMNKLG